MKTIRFKVFVSLIIILVLFLSCMIPFVTNSVQRIVIHSMNDRADELITLMQESKNESEMIKIVKDQSYFAFYHIALINDKLQILFDSHSKRLAGCYLIEANSLLPPEVQEAQEEGIGYAEAYVPILGKNLFYLAKSFDYDGKNYILRLSFPHDYIKELKKKFNFGFFFFSSLTLVLFSAITALILYHLMGPVRQIIRAIKPYQEGKAPAIPEIRIASILQDEFSDLAETFNLLSRRIKSHIQTVTHERNEKEAILESLTEGVIAVDNNLRISYANTMALEFLGFDRSVIGKAFPQGFHPRPYELLARSCNERVPLNAAIEIKQKGEILHLNAVSSPRQNSGAILVLQDKSIHYKILEMRKDFIANASHELKTPITIIRGFAETLHDNPDLDRKLVAEITNKLVKNSHRMTKIIKNLLTLADIENLPAFRLQRTSLIQLTETCIQHILASHRDAQITIHKQGPFTEDNDFFLNIDPELIEVALTNLLDNAAKYSKDTPVISVFLENDKVQGYTSIRVKDNGIGIPEIDLEHIFQRFYTVNKLESKNKGGSGLGLAIVETIIEKHLGRVFVESKPGEGSTFTIRIPNDLMPRLEKLARESATLTEEIFHD